MSIVRSGDASRRSRAARSGSRRTLRAFALISTPGVVTAAKCIGRSAAMLAAMPELISVAVYRRRIGASLERVWENVRDWEHLPWLHRQSFA